MRKIMFISWMSSVVFFLFASLNVCAADDELTQSQAYTWANSLTLEGITNFHGFSGNGARYLGDLDVSFKLDTGKTGWWKDGTFFVSGIGIWGQRPSEIIKETQHLSNIEAPNNTAKIFEFWYEHSFFNGDFKWLLGLHNYSNSFYSLDAASLFSDSSFLRGPEVAQVGPSIYPTTAVGNLFSFKHNDWYARMAVYDGVPGDPDNPRGTHVFHKPDEGLFKTVEFGIDAYHDYKIGFGTWQHTKKIF